MAIHFRNDFAGSSVGYDRGSNQPIQQVYAEGLAKAVADLKDLPETFIYISSTGVYGNASGQEVDEETPCQPTRAGGIASWAAEHCLTASHLREKSVILRLAGLFGPGRIPRSADLIAGRQIDAPAHGWLNLIHVDDAAQIVLLAESRALKPRTFVVSDGQPVQRVNYYNELARLLRAPPPRFIEAAEDSPAAQRAASDKRISPRRMFAELQPVLQFPSYREGLAAIIASERPELA